MRKQLLITCIVIGIFFSGCLSAKYQQVPDGAIWSSQIMKRETAPERFSTVVGWWQVVAINPENVPDKAGIVIEYIKLIEALPDGRENIIFERHYQAPLGAREYALFHRYPRWFAVNDNIPFSGGNIVDKKNRPFLKVGLAPDRIIHGWTDRIPVNHNARYYTEMKVKITKAALQLGCDFWIDMGSDYNYFEEDCKSSNNCEVWVSGWHYDTRGRFVVIREPQYNNK